MKRKHLHFIDSKKKNIKNSVYPFLKLLPHFVPKIRKRFEETRTRIAFWNAFYLFFVIVWIWPIDHNYY